MRLQSHPMLGFLLRDRGCHCACLLYRKQWVYAYKFVLPSIFSPSSCSVCLVPECSLACATHEYSMISSWNARVFWSLIIRESQAINRLYHIQGGPEQTLPCNKYLPCVITLSETAIGITALTTGITSGGWARSQQSLLYKKGQRKRQPVVINTCKRQILRSFLVTAKQTKKVGFQSIKSMAARTKSWWCWGW